MNSIGETCKKIYPQDSSTRAQAKERLEKLTMPYWALGDLMDLAIDLAGMSASVSPKLEKKVVVVMAGDHGVAAKEIVSKYPQEVTVQMAYNIMKGGAGVNALARQARSDVLLVDMGIAADFEELAKGGNIINKKVGFGTKNILKEPAMTRAMAEKTVENGIAIANEYADQYDVFATGELGIGNTTPATAISLIITQKPITDICGGGSGLNALQYANKMSIVEKAVEIHNPDPQDGIDILAKVGGFEIGGIAGMILGAAAHRKPIIVDGFISTSAAMIASKINWSCTEYMIFSHKSAELGHAAMLETLTQKSPLLDLKLRLGEGTGAAVAMNLVDCAGSLLTDVATFEEAAVSEADK